MIEYLEKAPRWSYVGGKTLKNIVKSLLAADLSQYPMANMEKQLAWYPLNDAANSYKSLFYHTIGKLPKSPASGEKGPWSISARDVQKFLRSVKQDFQKTRESFPK